MTVNESFAIVLRELRKSRKVSRAKMSRQIGLSRQGIAQIEDYAISVKLERVFQMAEVLDVTPEMLVKLVRERRYEE